VLFTCFNRNLADRLIRDHDAPSWENVTFLNYHQLVVRVLKSAAMTMILPEGWDGFNQAAEESVLMAVTELGDEFEPYDFLVVDEAQDLMSPEFFSVLDLLLKGGIEGGSWMLCVDPAQTIYNSQFDETVMGWLQKLGTQLHLDENCRNTKQIAAYVSGISRVVPERLVAVSGPAVEIDYFDDFAEYGRLLRKHLNNLIADFREMSIPSKEIVVLTFVNGAIEELDEATKSKFLLPVVHYSQRSDRAEVTWSSVHAFKGLEAVAVIVVVNGDISDEEQRKLFYVAGSRARARLVVLAPTEAGVSITNALPTVLSLLVSQ
jgi:superfamily I DNA/RNA helicase